MKRHVKQVLISAWNKVLSALNSVWNRALSLARYPIPHYTRPAMLLQGVIILVAACWFQLWLPVPGVAIGFLGVTAAIMAVRADHFSAVEKGVWILVSFALFVVEIRSIYTDRNDYATQQAEIRSKER